MPNENQTALTGEVRKSAAAFHNEAADAARRDDYQGAEAIVTEGLKLYPWNVDLLADAVSYSDGEKSAQYFNRLCAIDRSLWNWRAYVFCIDYLIDRLVERTEEKEKRDALFQTARDIAKEFKENLPYDERAYSCEAKIILAQEGENGRAEAMSILREAIIERNMPWLKKSSPTSPTDESAVAKFPVSQSCVMYGDMLLDYGQYDEAIQVATIGIAGTAQEQPSASVGYMYYLRALAGDAKLVLDDLDPEKPDAFFNEKRVAGVLRDYEIARRLLGSGRVEYQEQIKNRVTAIKLMSGIEDTDEDVRIRELEEENQRLMTMIELLQRVRFEEE